MTKEQLWAGLCERHPEFKDDEHVLKQRARGLRRIIDQAWDEGHAKGLETGKALGALEEMKKGGKGIFGGIF